MLFIAFFVAVALVHYLLPRVLRPYFLLATSYGFFCYDPVNRPLVGVLLGATAVSWLCGLIIGKVKVKPVRVLALLVTVLGFCGAAGAALILPVLAAEDVLEQAELFEGERFTIEGQIRSFNNREPTGRRLILCVYALSMMTTDAPMQNEAVLLSLIHI